MGQLARLVEKRQRIADSVERIGDPPTADEGLGARGEGFRFRRVFDLGLLVNQGLRVPVFKGSKVQGF